MVGYGCTLSPTILTMIDVSVGRMVPRCPPVGSTFGGDSIEFWDPRTRGGEPFLTDAPKSFARMARVPAILTRVPAGRAGRRTVAARPTSYTRERLGTVQYSNTDNANDIRNDILTLYSSGNKETLKDVNSPIKRAGLVRKEHGGR